MKVWSTVCTQMSSLYHKKKNDIKATNPVHGKLPLISVLEINRPYFPRTRKYWRFFPSPHIDRGAAEVNMAREIIKPVFSRPREIRVLSQED